MLLTTLTSFAFFCSRLKTRPRHAKFLGSISSSHFYPSQGHKHSIWYELYGSTTVNTSSQSRINDEFYASKIQKSTINRKKCLRLIIFTVVFFVRVVQFVPRTSEPHSLLSNPHISTNSDQAVQRTHSDIYMYLLYYHVACDCI